MYDTTYNSSLYETTSASPAEVAGAMMLFFGFFAVIALVSYVIYAIFLGMIFKKAGIESWKAWVPVYNTWLLLEMGDQPGWWSLLAFIPGVNIVAAVFMYIAMYHVGMKFGKDGVFVILAILLPIVWLIWLAVDKSAVWKPGNGGGSTPPQAPAAPNQPAAM